MADLSQPILVLDDLNTMTRIVDAMLRKCGFTNIEQVHDAATALIRMREQTFMLVLSDREMPEMNGIDFVRAVRADPGIRGTPVIMMSASDDPKHAETAIAAGASVFLKKPFNLTTLRDAVAHLLRDR